MVLLATTAAATTYAPSCGGFRVHDRDDAPTDGVLVVTTACWEVVQVEGPPVELVPEQVAWSTVLLRPTTPWVAGERYAFELPQLGRREPGRALAFTVGTAPAAEPVPPEVGEVVTTEWRDGAPTESRKEGGGCCFWGRWLAVTPGQTDPDPWSVVILEEVGTGEAFGEDAALPHEDRALSDGQVWIDGEGLVPGGYTLVALSAAGRPSARVAVPIPQEPPPLPEPEDDPAPPGPAGGCGGGGGSAGCVVASAFVRRPRSQRRRGSR